MAMADNNELARPAIHGKLHLTKPPLTYWLQAGCLKLLGDGQRAVRLPSAVAGAVTVLDGVSSHAESFGHAHGCHRGGDTRGNAAES